jgi:hypothetical protein
MTIETREGTGYLNRAGPAGPPPRAPALGGTAPVTQGTAHQGRGNAALYMLDRIAAQARTAVMTREDVTPEMEPLSPSLPSGDELADSEFDDDNEDVAPDMEPFDPSIESALRATAEENADGSVTISPEEGEEIVAVVEDDHGDVEVEIEDSADVLLTAPALNMPRPPRLARAQVEEHDDGSVTITPDEGEVLDVSEMGDGDLAVHVEEEE